MTDKVTFTIDEKEIHARSGQMIIEAADDAGVYVPRLCHKPGLVPFGSCRVCTVLINGRPASACTQPVAEGIVVENDTPTLTQAMAYRLGITAPTLPYQWPHREVDASHPDIMIDHNRCILCGRCVRASRDLDGKHVFGFVGRGPSKKIAVNADANLADTNADVTDQALDACPVGALLRKRVGYAVPVGRRLYDHEPIGTDIEAKKAAAST